MTRSGRVALFFIILVPFYLTWTFNHSLWNPDETRDGGIAAEMFRGGDYVVPKLNGEPFLEKPPLYYWAASSIYMIAGGVTAGATRLPAVLFGLLGIVATFLIGKRLFNERVALFGAAMLATSAQYFRMSHMAMMDIALASLVTAALASYISGSRAGLVAAAILAFYAKGFLGVVLVSVVVGPHLLLQKKPGELARLALIGGIAFAAAAAPWFWALWKKGGWTYLRIFVVDNHWARFFSKTADHTEHFWFFYFMSFPVDFLPWSAIFAGFSIDFLRNPGKYSENRGFHFLLTWFLGLLLFFTASSSKRSIYLLPVLPAAALLSAAWLDKMITGARFERPVERTFYGVCCALVLVLGIGSIAAEPVLDRKKSFIPVIEAARHATGVNGTIIGYNMSEMERGVLGFYLCSTFPNPRSPDALRKTLERLGEQPFCVIVNRTKAGEVGPVLQERANIVYRYRPDKSTRSYLVYAG